MTSLPDFPPRWPGDPARRRARAPSLRGRLIRRLAPAIILVWLAASAFILWRSWVDVTQAYRDQANHLAIAIAAVLDGGKVTPQRAVETLRPFQDHNTFVVVFLDGHEIYHTRNSPAGVQPGMSTRRERTSAWQAVTASTLDGRVKVVAGMQRGEAQALVIRLAAGAALPMLAALAVMLALALLAVGQALRPLEDLRARILARHPDQLEPLGFDDAPTELEPVVTALDVLLGRMRAALAQERRFVADASHELRTPLTAIKAHAQSIDPAHLCPAERATLAQVLRGVDRATRVTRQLLSLARADRPEGPGRAACSDLAAIAGAVAAELYPLAVRAGLELAVESTPATARADPADVEILLANLVENAIAHAGTGALCRIRCGATETEGWFIVEDSGPGIPPELRDAVFARFHRGPRPSGDGAGLGLAIVTALATRSGGSVTLDAAPDLGGTRVTIRLPRPPAPEASTAAEGTPPQA